MNDSDDEWSVGNYLQLLGRVRSPFRWSNASVWMGSQTPGRVQYTSMVPAEQINQIEYQLMNNYEIIKCEIIEYDAIKSWVWNMRTKIWSSK